MADSSNAGNDAGGSTASYHPTAQFKPHTWWNPASGLDIHQQHYASFLQDARDVVQGAHTLVELLSWDDLRRELATSPAEPTPVFDAFHRGSLERLLAASLNMLGAQIEGQFEMLARVSQRD
jgi:hypothetical protein